MRRPEIYAGNNPLDLPAYSLKEISHCLQVPTATIRAWALGRNDPSTTGERFSEPLIEIADRHTPAPSFRNMVELHVLSAIWRKHKVEMPAVRKALLYLADRLGIARPLADQQMLTDGASLFIERYGTLVNISQGGQLEMKELVGIYLKRVERDPAGLPIRFFPFTRTQIDDAPRLVVMDPTVQFGRPCIVGMGIPTAVIAERYRAGDAIGDVAKDYGQAQEHIEEAIRYEFAAIAA